MKSGIRNALAALAIVAGSSSAGAGIVSTSGAVQFVASPPSDVSSNQWESNTIIRAFDEQQGLTLPQDVAVDITLPGTSPGATTDNLSPGVIPAGMIVNSYALHFDVNGTRATDNALEATGSVTLGDDILGLIVISDNLNSSNGILGLPGLTYANGPDHGLEINPAGGGTSDFITLSSDRRTVTVDLMNASFSDDVRILTAVPAASAVPLPAAAWQGSIILSILVGVGIARGEWVRRRLS